MIYRSLRVRVALTVIAGIAGHLSAAPEPSLKKEVRARASHAQLEAKKTDAKIDPRIALEKEPKPLKKIRSGKTESLIGRSAVLSYGRHWTLVPKNAVLYVPKHLRTRVGAKPEGTLLRWQAFFAKNRGWIHTQRVTMKQAKGQEPLPENLGEMYEKLGRVVVATLHGGAISVRKPKAEGEPVVAAQPEATEQAPPAASPAPGL